MIGNWNARDGGLVVCKLPKVKAGRPVRSPSESTTTTRPPLPPIPTAREACSTEDKRSAQGHTVSQCGKRKWSVKAWQPLA